MVRTIITISQKDKEWLDRFSHQYHQSVAETIRKAIAHFRKKSKKGIYLDALERTAGLWKKRSHQQDGLRYVERLRSEWR